MKLKINNSSALRHAVASREGGFTPTELLVVIAITAILVVLAVPALTRALNKAQIIGTMNNCRQLYLAQFQMSNDGSATRDASSAWPGDLPVAPADLVAYLNVLCGKGYLKGGDAIKLVNAPGASFTADLATVAGVDTLSNPAGTAGLKVWMLKDVDPATSVFATTRNYVYDTALVATDIPYGTKGFITIRKGGDANIYRVGQATIAGWPGGGTVFQNSVGYKPGDTVGTPTAGDPTLAAKPLTFPAIP